MKFDDYLNKLVQAIGSDLYLSVGAHPAIRVNNQLTRIADTPLTSSDTAQIAKSIMSSQQAEQFAKEWELNLAHVTKSGRFRINIFKQRGEVGLVVRRINLSIPKMEDLHLPEAILKKLALKRRGLILFVGSAGSGKSTSLATMLDYRNENEASHIITIEDPMEYVHEHKQSIIEQREVGFDTHDYQHALHSALRQAPDVIVIGEIRDRETMEKTINFAETGHLVISTLHANNANEAIRRILSFFPEDTHHRVLLDLSLNIRAIISQRLINAKQKGLIPAIEILLDSALVRDLIKRGDVHTLKEIMEKSSLAGMQTFDTALYHLYKSGAITYEDALAHADSSHDLQVKISLEKKGENDKTISLDDS